jgi:hypothetical protein
VLSAIVPTAIAQRWFSPRVEAEREADRRGLEPGAIPAEEFV